MGSQIQMFDTDLQTHGTTDLVAEADGESVTSDRLSDDGFIGESLLDERAIVDYLAPGEQPHHILFNRTEGVQRNGVDTRGEWSKGTRNLLVVTDRRLLLCASSNGVDRVEAIPFFLVEDVTLRTVGKHEVSIETEAASYVFELATDSADAAELQSAVDYIDRQAKRCRRRDEPPAEQQEFRVNTRQAADLWSGSVHERNEAVNEVLD